MPAPSSMSPGALQREIAAIKRRDKRVQDELKRLEQQKQMELRQQKMKCEVVDIQTKLKEIKRTRKELASEQNKGSEVERQIEREKRNKQERDRNYKKDEKEKEMRSEKEMEEKRYEEDCKQRVLAHKNFVDTQRATAEQMKKSEAEKEKKKKEREARRNARMIREDERRLMVEPDFKIKQFINTTNACYANCLLHCLLNHEPFRKRLVRGSDRRPLALLARQYTDNNLANKMNAMRVRKELGGEWSERVDGLYKQQDPEEFLTLLSAEYPEIVQELGFREVSTYFCQLCSYNNQSALPTLCMQLGVEESDKNKTHSLVDLIERTYKLELRDDTKCSLCQETGSVYLKNHVSRPGSMLAVMLKIAGSGGKRFIKIKNVLDESLAIEGSTYAPISAIFHHGTSLEGGHYVCFLKHGTDWMLADDLSPNPVVSSHFPNPAGDTYGIGELYMIFYGKKRCSADLRQSSGDQEKLVYSPKTRDKANAVLENTLEKLRYGAYEIREYPMFENLLKLFWDFRVPSTLIVDHLQKLVRVFYTQLQEKGIQPELETAIREGQFGSEMPLDPAVFHDIVIPDDLIDTFIDAVQADTNKGKPRIGLLCGYPISCIGVKVVTELLIPKQKVENGKVKVNTAPRYLAKNNEFFTARGVQPVAWIQTHKNTAKPDNTMTSWDLHRQAKYQKMHKDFVSIICSHLPIWDQPGDLRVGFYSLTEQGMKEVNACPVEEQHFSHNFHPAQFAMNVILMHRHWPVRVTDKRQVVVGTKKV